MGEPVNLLDLAMPVAAGGKAAQYTGKTDDALIATGFSAFVQSVTGTIPAVTQLPDRRAKITLNPAQAALMTKWLDSQVAVLVAKPKAQTLDIDMNSIMIPWAMKYLIPSCLIFFVGGWLLHYYMTRR